MTDDGPRGLERLYHDSRAELLRFLTARTGDAGEAEEIFQDLWLRVRATDAGPVANGRAYLYRMAQNLVLDRVRARQRQMQRERRWLEDRCGGADLADELPDLSDNAEQAMLARDEIALLLSAIATIPDRAREAFMLHKLDELPHPEVASRMGVSRSAVEKHIAVAMKYLRRALVD